MKRAWILVFGTVPGLLAAFAAVAQPADGGDVKSFDIARIDAEIDVDGRLDDAVWSRATVIDDLHQIEPFEYTAPSQRTEIRIYYDEDALYVGASLFDTEADAITANVLRQGDGLNAEDRFAVILDPYLDRRSGYRFELNANGVRWDALYQDTTQLEANWDGIWEGAATRDDEGWTAEIRIPFKTLSFNPNTTDWGINFERAIQRVGETIGWVSRNRQLNPGVAGTASGFEGVEQGRGLDIVPSMTVVRAKTYGPGGTSSSDVEPSVDIFYKVTPSLNASLTINTDFSATEVDDRQVNLTRFSLFFPEKRDFFLKDADIFEFGRIGGQGGGGLFGSGGGGGAFNPNRNFAVPNAAVQNARPFFSRRIGLSATGQPVDIEAGAKVSGRVGRWNIGSLLIRQDEFQAVDANDIFVGRIAANVLDESAFGVIMTDGDPRSNLESSLIGTDFRYRNSRLPGGRMIEAQVWYQQSDNEGINGNDRAYGAGFSVPNAQGWRYGYEVKVIEQNFFPAVGFIDRVGVRDYQANFGFQHRSRDSDSFMRGVYSGVDYYRRDRLGTGTLDTEIIGVRLFSMDSNRNDRIFMQYTFNHEILLNPFTIYRAPDTGRTVIVPAGDYRYEELRIGGRSGQQRRVSAGGSYTFGDFYNGTSDAYNLSLSWRPSERFRFGISYNVNDVAMPEGDFTTRLSSISAEFILSSTLSWVNLIQYDNLSENIGLNSRLHWIPQAGREGFIVFNHNLVDIDRNDSFHSTSADIAIKFSYTWRF
ncbi:MAG: carbohydrate binding family 9 domain-containing protein [Gammaproteobacteria bacterium]|nr:carbohydrate binding family 9 domain-containing protein [Gammaproteobacteria bacterium]